ncbi:hypothetical protein P3X46_013336 [Hevea brasiliensis]|uniref:Phorbol-ester/DAG-type domain-containing protein n=1 Tax=Hevea brasiliensis TaxID=3981 RepID=A0ABQ9M350_HEVBR|nr:uncharacterized protein LOC110642467 [Hevea brasiliensis]XP_058007101.1 uncharacterized protein LOC110642467 [Hevea brasiliensis]XP_058007102.1 uncharacterized protein LOC110642467 [Hevea brasiliensis]KAJ9174721.1 hypothetical protein P3X46_013336 [Hevea brasiliensis]
MEIQHFLHNHPLKFYENSDFDDLDCSGCGNSLSVQTYGCVGCEFFLHKSCAKLPREIQHFFHPCTLFLRIGSYVCNACYSNHSRTFGYRCKRCDFDLDVDCARLSTMKSEGDEDQIQHYSHRHPLKFLAKMGDEVLCQICEKVCSDNVYNCRPCNFYIHKSCKDMLPQKLQVFFHPCQLVLLTTPSYYCDACEKDSSGLTFRCGKCYFQLCVKCFRSSSASKSEGKQIEHFMREMEIQHFLHEHTLKLYKNSDFDDLDCSGCGNSLSVQTYGCVGCEFFLHKSCAKLPREIQHFFHPCTLFLRIGSYVCNACYSNHSRTFGYRCKRCDFDLDVDCARLSTMKSEGDEDQIQHYSHRHPLKFLAKMGDEVLCQICEKVCSDNVYNCRPCNFYIHKSCKDMLPQKLQVFFHPCQLVLLTTPSYYCDACEKDSSGLTFRCGKCYFQLCVKCFLLSSATKTGEKQIQHFSHWHPLMHFETMEEHEVSCGICTKLCSAPTYGCQGCNFYLHKFCMETLEKEIQLFFHPCSLISLSTPSYTCDACGIDRSGVYFRCCSCRFKLCIACSRMCKIIDKDYEDDEDDVEFEVVEWQRVEHFSHHHPLILVKMTSENYFESTCKICGKPFSDATCFFCFRCKLCFHKSCMDRLPRKIDQHFFHSCSLILLTTPSYKCDACEKNCSQLTFRCGKCQFHLCLECSLLPRIKPGAFEKIQHFLHEHPLILSEKKVVEVPCNACGAPCFGSTYGCSRCNLILHKSCAELPQTIRNSHLSHSLTLASLNSKERRVTSEKSRKARCRLCLRDCCDFAFRCNKCDFQLDVECALLKPRIEYPGHNHLLTVVEKIHDELKCNFCKTCCKDSAAFRCLECNFSLHLLCGPLPCTIKHKCHIDTLTLKDQYVEDDDEDDDFYCDVCERQRDPKLCVYYCSEGCPMIAEVKCVISEVMASLKGKRGNVELRIVGRYISSKMISKELAIEETEQNEIVKDASKSKYIESMAVLFDDILVSLEAAERKQLDDIEEAIRKGIETNITSLESSSEYTSSFAYSEEAFKRFMDRLDSVILDYQIPDFILEHEEFITFQDYLIPRTLIPTFQDLLSKNEDICAGSMLSPKAKSLIFYFLCGVIENMRATRIVDITDQKLGEWFACLKWVKYAGFKFQFIFEHMKYLAHAHFVVQARKRVEDFPVQLKQEIAQISQEIDKLKVKLRELEDQQEFYQRQEKSIRSSLTKQHCDVPSAIKWKPAADGLL